MSKSNSPSWEELVAEAGRKLDSPTWEDLVEEAGKNLGIKQESNSDESIILFRRLSNFESEEVDEELEYKPSTLKRECSDCFHVYKNSVGLTSHRRTVHEKLRYDCTKSEALFTRKDSLKYHLKQVHDGNTSTIKCPNCEKEFVSSSRLKMHQKFAHDKNINGLFSCPLCNLTLKHKSSVNTHLANIHGEWITYVGCPICEKKFTYENLLKKHFKKAHSDKRFSDFRQDMKVVQNEPPIKQERDFAQNSSCHICGKTFVRKQNLERHVKNVHEKTKFKSCNVKQTHGKSMAVPVVDVKKESLSKKMFPCQLCEKTFSRKEIVQEHIRAFHEKIRYKCPSCPVERAYKYDLHRHVKQAHGRLVAVGPAVEVKKEMFPCNQCDKTYTSPHSTRRHKKMVHDKIRFQCQFCAIEYVEKRNLDRHVDKAHAGQNLQHECRRCGKTFKMKAALNKHVTKIHEFML